MATDMSDSALVFEIISSDATGSKLNVYTDDRRILSNIISALQSQGLDPSSIVPDVNCLAELIQHNSKNKNSHIKDALLGVFSCKNGFFFRALSSDRVVPMRAFKLGGRQDRNERSCREISKKSPRNGSLMERMGQANRRCTNTA